MFRGRLRGVQALVQGPTSNKQRNGAQEPGGLEFKPMPFHATVLASRGSKAAWSRDTFSKGNQGLRSPKFTEVVLYTTLALLAAAAPTCYAWFLTAFDSMFLCKTQAIMTEKGLHRSPWGPFPLSTKSQEGFWEEHLHTWCACYISFKSTYTWGVWAAWRESVEHGHIFY